MSQRVDDGRGKASDILVTCRETTAKTLPNGPALEYHSVRVETTDDEMSIQRTGNWAVSPVTALACNAADSAILVPWQKPWAFSCHRLPSA